VWAKELVSMLWRRYQCLALLGIEPQLLRHPAYSLFSVPTKLQLQRDILQYCSWIDLRYGCMRWFCSF
jgi:hypothetical protein